MSTLTPRHHREREMPKPTYYVRALDDEFKEYAYNEKVAPKFKGKWCEEAFLRPLASLDLEIGTGNGYFFAHRAQSFPERNLLGIEIKYKPLIQSIRRALKQGSKNARVARYDASFVTDLFKKEELGNIFIHFPDPWAKKKQKKHRLLKQTFLDSLFELQKENGFLEFKTDSRDYFDWAIEEVKKSRYKITALSYDLHNSELAENNYKTHFEKLFIRQKIPINYLLAVKIIDT